jgi:hypothetical protein
LPSGSEDDESGEWDSFIATSDEVLPRGGRALGSRTAGKGSAGAKGGKGAKGARSLGHAAGHFEDEDSPLKTRYIRGATPPPPVYGNRSWIEALEEQDQKRRDQVEQILSGRDLPLRVTSLHWPRLQPWVNSPQTFRQVLQRFLHSGHSLRLPPYLVDNGPVSPGRMRIHLEALALAQSPDGKRCLCTDADDLMPQQAGQVVQGMDDCGMLLWGSGGGVVEVNDGDDLVDADEKIGAPEETRHLDATSPRVWVGRGADCPAVLAGGAGPAKNDRSGERRGGMQRSSGWERLEQKVDGESEARQAGDLVMLQDLCVDARTQLLQREDEDERDTQGLVRRYLDSRLWGGDKVVRERLWNVFSANAVRETARQTAEYETVTKKYYHIDDPYELQWERERKREARQGTDCYVGPGGKRPELHASDVSSFFSRMSLADMVVHDPQGRSREVFLPGRQDVEKLQELAFSQRRASAAAEELSAMRKRALRGQWPGIPPRGMFEKTIRPPGNCSSDNPAQKWNESRHARDAATAEGGAGRNGQSENVAVDLEAWTQHVKGLGAFVLSLGDELAHVAALLARQSASQRANDRWSSTTLVEWLADAPPPATSALACLRLDAEPAMGFVAAQCPDAAEKLLAQMLPRLTSDWAGKPFLFTYPRAFHDGIDRVLTNGARLPKHWLQPVSLYIAPDSGPRILWACHHPAVHHRHSTQQQQDSNDDAGHDRANGRSVQSDAPHNAHPLSISAGAAYDALRRISMRGRLVPASSFCSAAAPAALAAGDPGLTQAGKCGSVEMRHKMRLRRVRIRSLEERDVSVVAACWMFASETAEAEVARLIATRRCVGVEVEDVAPDHEPATGAAGHDGDATGDATPDATPLRHAWFYWLEPCTQEPALHAPARVRDGTDCDVTKDVKPGAADLEETKAGMLEPKSEPKPERETGLVSWALEDEAGGVGMVYTAVSWRRKGLGRWALSRLFELAHLDWLQQRRCACAHVPMWRVMLGACRMSSAAPTVARGGDSACECQDLWTLYYRARRRPCTAEHDFAVWPSPIERVVSVASRQ